MKSKLISFGILAGGLAACSQPAADVIRLNQMGYFPSQESAERNHCGDYAQSMVANGAFHDGL